MTCLRKAWLHRKCGSFPSRPVRSTYLPAPNVDEASSLVTNRLRQLKFACTAVSNKQGETGVLSSTHS